MTADDVMCVVTPGDCVCAADEEHAPVKVGDFTEKLALLRANDDEALEDEYAVSVCVCVHLRVRASVPRTHMHEHVRCN